MIYLDNAAGSHPKPEAVYQEADRALRSLSGFPDAGGHGPARQAAALMDGLRAELAGLMGLSRPEGVILTAGGTDALTLALKGLLRDGDHVVTSSLERDAVSRPLTHLQMGGHIALTRVEGGADGRLDPAAVLAAVGHRTRLVVLAHGCEALGTVQPIEEIARGLGDRNALLLVDAAHTAGLVPIDMAAWGIDALAVPGHRGLYGPAGVGALLLGDRPRPRPLREGQSGGDPTLSTQPLDLPWRLEAGTPSFSGLAGLAAGLRFVREQTPARLRDHDITLIKRFIGALGLDERFTLHAARGDVPRTGTVSFSLRGFEPAQVAAILDRDYGIQVAAGLHACAGAHRQLGTHPAGTVRVSVGWFSREEDLDRTVAALREMADAGMERAGRLARA